jgi:hypothetical protein
VHGGARGFWQGSSKGRGRRRLQRDDRLGRCAPHLPPRYVAVTVLAAASALMRATPRQRSMSRCSRRVRPPWATVRDQQLSLALTLRDYARLVETDRFAAHSVRTARPQLAAWRCCSSTATRRSPGCSASIVLPRITTAEAYARPLARSTIHLQWRVVLATFCEAHSRCAGRRRGRSEQLPVRDAHGVLRAHDGAVQVAARARRARCGAAQLLSAVD